MSFPLLMNNKAEYTESLPESHQARHLHAEPRQLAMRPTLLKAKRKENNRTITEIGGILKVKLKEKKM